MIYLVFAYVFAVGILVGLALAAWQDTHRSKAQLTDAEKKRLGRVAARSLRECRK